MQFGIRVWYLRRKILGLQIEWTFAILYLTGRHLYFSSFISTCGLNESVLKNTCMCFSPISLADAFDSLSPQSTLSESLANCWLPPWNIHI